MSKLNIEIDLNNYIDEETIDDYIHRRIDASIKDAINDAVTNYIDKKINDFLGHDAEEKIASIINERMNQYMDEFFNKPFDKYDDYGDLIKKNVTVKDILKSSCDNFLTQKVNDRGETRYGTQARIDYMVEKALSYASKTTLETAVNKAVNKIKEEANALAMKGLGDKLAKMIGKDTLIG